MKKTQERIKSDNFSSREDYLLFLRHFFVYKFVGEKISKDARVLDLGFGEGYGSEFLSKKSKITIGLDVDEDTVSYANKKYGKDNCIFKKYDGKDIPFENDYFDVVVSFQVIEHVYDDVKYVKNIFNVLKKGGLFFSTTPNKATRETKNGKSINKFHIREYYAKELESILKTSFSNVNVSGIFGRSDIMDIERERIDFAVKIVNLDFLGIYRSTPEFLKDCVKKIIRNFKKQKKSFSYSDYSVEDFYVSDKEVEKSIDLFAICKK